MREQNTPPAATWDPPDKLAQASNLMRLMREAGVSNYQDLHAWSAACREQYWQRAIDTLGIRLQRPWTTMLDMSRGAEHARWMVGAQWNIVESCLPPDRADEIAIVEPAGDGSLSLTTVDQLDRLSSRVARSLQRAGIRRGDAVALLTPMNRCAVAAFLGVLKRGAVAVGIAESFTSAEIEVRLQLSHARLIIVQDVVRRGGKQHSLYQRLAAIEAPPAVVAPCGDQLAVPLRDGDNSWGQFVDHAGGDTDDAVGRPFQAVEAGNDFPVAVLTADDPIGVLFSSGTTAEPKAIPWSNLCPLKCAADAHYHHDIHPGDVLAWPTSLGWMMGPWLIFASLLNRAAMALFDDVPASPAFAQFVQRSGVTMLGTVPSLVAAWRSQGCLDGADWSGIRLFSSTGECSNADDMAWLMRQAGGRPVIEYCGGTEIAGGYITGAILRPCTAGTFNTPALGLDLVILDEAGAPAERGELFLIPPSIGLSTTLLNGDHHDAYYAGCPNGPQGQLLRRHGDEMQQLPGGYWRAHGRVDDTMNLGGIKVSSAEIERAAATVPQVREAAAVAEAPEQGGPSRLVVYVVAADGADEELLLPAIRSAVRDQLNPLFRVDRVVTIDQLPRTASNKIMRRRLRATKT